MKQQHPTQKGYETLGTLDVSQVLPLIKNQDIKRAEFFGVSVGVESTRLMTFLKKGLVCQCGRKGARFYVERNNKQSNGWHLNLRDAEGCLMTHDHTLARSLGGADNLNNTTTMCFPCNNKKASVEELRATVKRKGAVPPWKGNNYEPKTQQELFDDLSALGAENFEQKVRETSKDFNHRLVFVARLYRSRQKIGIKE